MAAIPRTVHVEPGSALDRALDEAGDAPVELDKRGVRYRVTRIDAAGESPTGATGVADDAILTLIGLGASEEPTDIARQEQQYLADAIDSARQP